MNTILNAALANAFPSAAFADRIGYICRRCEDNRLYFNRDDFNADQREHAEYAATLEEAAR